MGISAAVWLRNRWSNPVIANIGSTFATRIAVMVMGIITSIVTARVLGPEGRGAYASAAAVGAFAVSFGNLGLHNANTYLVAGNRSRLGALLGNTLMVCAVWGGLLGVAVYVVASVFVRSIAGMHSLVVCAALLVPTMLCYTLLENIAMGVERFDLFNFTEALNGSSNLALTLGAAALAVLTPAFVIASSVAVWLVAGGALLVSLWRTARPTLSRSLLIEAGKYGWRPYLISVASYSITRMDLLVISRSQGLARAGQYSVAISLVALFNTFPAVVGQVLFPRLGSIADIAERWRLTWRSAVLLAALTAFVGLIACLVATPAVRLVFGTAFVGAVMPFRWLLVGAFFMAVHVVVVQYLNSIGCPVPVVLLWVVAAAVNVGLNMLLVPIFGVLGGAFASSATYALTAIGVCGIAWAHRPGLLVHTQGAMA